MIIQNLYKFYKISKVKDFVKSILSKYPFCQIVLVNLIRQRKMKIYSNFVHVYKHVASMLCDKMNDEESISNNKKLQIKCNRCNRIWNYKGLNPYYATCTFCKRSVNLRKNKIQSDAVIGVSHQPDQSQRGKLS
jgi:hypothetical protein